MDKIIEKFNIKRSVAGKLCLNDIVFNIIESSNGDRYSNLQMNLACNCFSKKNNFRGQIILQLLQSCLQIILDSNKSLKSYENNYTLTM